VTGRSWVALVGEDEATVKRFFREKDKVRLQPENKRMKPIRFPRRTPARGRVCGGFSGGSRDRPWAVEMEARMFEPSEGDA